MNRPPSNFPENFFWGASTASHQVEGRTYNQWSVWESAHAMERVRTAKKRLGWQPNWQDIKDQAEDPTNYISGDGVEHYKRYQEDFKLLKELNLNSFRFGIEWSRIEPVEGKWNQEAIDHYKTYIAELKRQGIEPFMNIWHWTNPVWFEEKGAFTKESNLKYFERYVQKVAEELLGDVKYVLTINEANNYMAMGYLLGAWPPQQKNNIVNGLKVYSNLAEAHNRSYKILKTKKPSLQIGVAHDSASNFPKNSKNPFHRLAARFSDYFWDTWYFKKINDYQDFVGVNFYHTNYWKSGVFKNPTKPLNDMGWYMDPTAVHNVIMRLSKRFNKPIIITENGAADSKDKYRKWWIEGTIKGMSKAINEGADLRGYLHWSLLDNFEWSEGWWPKFGLVEVDRKNDMKRTVRPSAKWFAEKIKQL